MRLFVTRHNVAAALRAGYAGVSPCDSCSWAALPSRWLASLVSALRIRLLVYIVAMTGCAAPHPMRPICSISYPPTSATTDRAVLLLPGRRSRAKDFEKEGFVAAVRERRLNVEVVAVDAHLGYYLEDRYRDLPAIIQEDVVQPLIQRGFKEVWLVGTSLGSLGAVAYAKKHPNLVAGLLLMGAYLGEEPILDEIDGAGGLARWMPATSIGYDYEQRTWQWLKGYSFGERRPLLHLAWGDADRFARASRLLAPLVPAARVFVTTGGHDFDTWSKLWARFLDATGQKWRSAGTTLSHDPPPYAVATSPQPNSPDPSDWPAHSRVLTY